MQMAILFVVQQFKFFYFTAVAASHAPAEPWGFLWRTDETEGIRRQQCFLLKPCLLM